MAGKTCCRSSLVFVNCLFLLACAGLIYIGIWSLREYSAYGHVLSNVFMIGLPVGILFFGGCLLFVVAIIGLIATCTGSKCLTAMYCTVQLVTFVLLMASVALLYACENMVTKNLEKDIYDGLQKFYLDPNVTREIDHMQQSNKCCGCNNYTDWVGTPWYKNQSSTVNGTFPYPESCCPHSNCTEYVETNQTHVTTNVFNKGCYSAISENLFKKFVISSSVSAAVALLLIIAFVCICVLYNQRPDFEFIGLVEDDAVRV